VCKVLSRSDKHRRSLELCRSYTIHVIRYARVCTDKHIHNKWITWCGCGYVLNILKLHSCIVILLPCRTTLNWLTYFQSFGFPRAMTIECIQDGYKGKVWGVVYANNESLQSLNHLLDKKNDRQNQLLNPSQYMCVQGNYPARTWAKQVKQSVLSICHLSSVCCMSSGKKLKCHNLQWFLNPKVTFEHQKNLRLCTW